MLRPLSSRASTRVYADTKPLLAPYVVFGQPAPRHAPRARQRLASATAQTLCVLACRIVHEAFGT
eukprot:2675281-Rhodomonas_salina.9